MGRIHGTIVAATVGVIVAATITCSVYTGRLLRPSSPRRWSQQSYRWSSPRPTPV